MVKLKWGSGTGFDFFVSIYVLNHPQQFGLRPSWAAGVRSRLSAGQRDFLEMSSQLFSVPLVWLGNLSEGMWSAKSLIHALEVMPRDLCLPVLMDRQDASEAFWEILHATKRDEVFSPAQTEVLRREYQKNKINLTGEMLSILHQIWQDPFAFLEKYLELLNAYYQTFFIEEESRIHFDLEQGLEKARELAEHLTIPDLVTRFSKGVHFNILPEIDELVLAPSYWASPFVFYRQARPGRLFLIFGCRKEDQALVPGEPIPPGLVNGLKALADPTRLRILRYLVDEPLTPSELSRRLRLRPPTVIHHLSALRLAGLVQIDINVDGERRYALRRAAIEEMYSSLNDFMGMTVPLANAPSSLQVKRTKRKEP